jgi:hypothetical protein
VNEIQMIRFIWFWFSYVIDDRLLFISVSVMLLMIDSFISLLQIYDMLGSKYFTAGAL